MLFERVEQFAETDRFRYIAVHARGQTTFFIALHDMRRHRDDGNMLPGLIFAVADSCGCFQAVHFGHLYVHQDEIEGLRAEGCQRLQAVTCDHDGMAGFFEHALGDSLVDYVVLGEQNPQWDDGSSLY